MGFSRKIPFLLWILGIIEIANSYSERLMDQPISIEYNGLYGCIEYSRMIGTNISNHLIFPTDSLKITIDIIINGKSLSPDRTDILEVFDKCISNGKLWDSLGYTIRSHWNKHGVHLQLFSNDLQPIIEDLGKDNIGLLSSLVITLKFGSEHNIDIIECANMTNHLMTLLLLRLEHPYRLVFSVYGRKYFMLNYRYTKQNFETIRKFNIDHVTINKPRDLDFNNLLLKSVEVLYDQCTEYSLSLVLKSKQFNKALGDWKAGDRRAGDWKVGDGKLRSPDHQTSQSQKLKKSIQSVYDLTLIDIDVFKIIIKRSVFTISEKGSAHTTNL